MPSFKSKETYAVAAVKKDTGNFIHFIERYKIKPVIDGLQYKVGEPKQDAGWIFHLSAIRSQVKDLFETVLPYLVEMKIPFRIYLNEMLNGQMLNGDLGYTEIGKVITVFPTPGQELQTARTLISLTEKIKGPAVPTDRYLGGAVYTRYAAIRPITMLDASGKLKPFYTNGLGQLVQDEITIPYSPAKFVLWPFASIVKQTPAKQPKFYKRKYCVFYWLKEDVKGYVGKGINMINLLNHDWCLIKEGKGHMAHDDHGRDIHDRLTWQWDLQMALYKKVRVPKPLDFFVKEGNTYFVMEFIEGKSFQEKITLGLAQRAWFSVDAASRIILLTHYLNILDQVAILHANGYVHRDLTPGNFVITKKSKEYLIDLEMSYSIKMERPHPPFKFGTWGFMSPEQKETATPTFKEDIYGLGAMLIAVLTDYIPTKFEEMLLEQRMERIAFFSGDRGIAGIAAACMQEAPGDRPSIEAIKSETQAYITRIKENTNRFHEPNKPMDPTLLRMIIQKGINGLMYNDYVNGQGLWTTKMEQAENTVGNLRLDREVLPGFRSGIAGIVYTLATAVKAGFSTRNVAGVLNKGIQFIQKDLQQHATMPPGLFGGSAGLAVAVRKAVESRMITRKTELQDLIASCFSAAASEPSLSMGKAGQGIGLLSCTELLGARCEKRLKTLVAEICQMQGKDGSWRTPDSSMRQLAKTKWWADGVAGIAYFLGCYLEAYDDPEALESLEKALHYLGDQADPKQSLFDVVFHDKMPPKYSLRAGRAGLGLTYVQAYKATKNELYRATAEKVLSEIPPYFSKGDLTMNTGMAGIGEVYLEAAIAFDAPIWRQRADWVVNALMHQYTERENDCITWNTSNTIINTADFMMGQAGVVYFLTKYLCPQNTEPLFY